MRRHRLYRVVFIVVAILAGGTTRDRAEAAASFSIDDYKDGEVLRYTTPLLQGRIGDDNLTAVSLTNLSSHRDTRQLAGMASHGRFKVFADLVPGVNDLLIKAGLSNIHFKLSYKPQTNPYIIRAVLFTDDTGDTRFETPLPNDPQNYRGKFDTLLKIMQSYTAEWMNHYGYGRRTFNLELGRDGNVVVHVVKGSKPADHYRYDIDRNGLYDEITDEVIKDLPKALSVDCTLIAFSKQDRKLGHSVAYTALGGGKVALFGGACMYSFPDTISTVQQAFVDPTYVDGKAYVSDSVDRFTLWGTASTSMGAMLHEMGHSMGLPHSNDPWDIMTRGIDNFGRYFVFYDPPSRRNPDTFYFTPKQVGYWSPVSAASLAPAVWMDIDAKPHPASEVKTTVSLTPDGNNFIIANPRGIGFVGFERPGVAHAFDKIDYNKSLPTMLKLPTQTVFSAVAGHESQFRIIDGNGVMQQFDLSLFEPGLIRRWHVLNRETAAKDAPASTTPTDAQVNQVFHTVMQQPVTTFGGAAQFPAAPAGKYAMTYAGTSVVSPAAQTVTLHSGCQGALRLWVNGHLCVDLPDGSKVDADGKTDSVELLAGPNTILAELGHGPTPGLIFARFTNASGNTLQVAADGTLTPVSVPELIQAPN